MHVYIDFVSISEVTSSCSISLNVGIVICIVSSVSVRPVNKIAKKKKNKKKTTYQLAIIKLRNKMRNVPVIFPMLRLHLRGFDGHNAI